MRCEQWFEAVSALVDDEDPGVDPRLLRAHLADCTDCSALRDEMEELRRSARVGEAEVIPDLSARIMKAVALADRKSRWLVVRVLLAVISIYSIAVSMVTLVVADDASGFHGARHIGAFTLAYGAGLLVVVARPARARTMLPVSITLAFALAITAVVDVLEGQVPFVNEALHGPELVSVLLVWLLSVPALHGHPGSERQRVPLRPPLQVVGQPPTGQPSVANRDVG